MRGLIIQIGDVTNDASVCVVRYISNSDALVKYKDEVQHLEAGMVIGANALVNWGYSLITGKKQVQESRYAN